MAKALLHGFELRRVALLHGFELHRAPAGFWRRVRGREGVCGCGADAAHHAKGGKALDQKGELGLEEPVPGLPARGRVA